MAKTKTVKRTSEGFGIKREHKPSCRLYRLAGDERYDMKNWDCECNPRAGFQASAHTGDHETAMRRGEAVFQLMNLGYAGKIVNFDHDDNPRLLYWIDGMKIELTLERSLIADHAERGEGINFALLGAASKLKK
jgi:hypothetical protein